MYSQLIVEAFTEQHILSTLNHDFAVHLRLPDLDSFEFGKLEDISPPETHVADTSSEHGRSETADNSDDIWQLQSDRPNGSKLRTWEAFLDDSHDEPHATYISEAGPGVFDALLDDQSKEHTEVLQSAFYLKCLGLLGLGQSSALFQWSAKSRNFEQTLGGVRYMGCSIPCTTSITRQLSEIGASFVELRTFIETSYTAKAPLSARIALARCLQVILEVLEQELSSTVPGARTPLQVLSHLHVPGQILFDLKGIVKAGGATRSNSEFISRTHRKVQEFNEACTPLSKIYRDVLDRTCRPWLHDIERMVGLDGMPSAAPDVEEAEIFSSLVAPEDGMLIAETSAGLNILQSSLPNHPLTNLPSWGIKPLDSHDADMETILLRARQYEQDLMSAVKKYNDGSAQSNHLQDYAIESSAPDQEQMPWQDNGIQQDYFADIGSKFAQLPGESLPSLELLPEDLRDLVVAVIRPHLSYDNASINDSAEIDGVLVDMNPLRTLEPLLSVQARIVNGSIMRLLLRHCDLRKHLSLQHSFHLFGNGVFLQRLTTALFSSESSSAERGRDNMSSGAAMGLRLDSRDRWPPASSELRLSLMGILSESYNERSQSVRNSPQDLPGGLSFAIREMEDAEIEKIMDPHSIFALDFLRIQYAAPTPVDAIITPSSLQKYDDIFRFLLRLVRMIHVSTAMKISSCHSVDSATDKTLKAFAHDAYHIVAALASYIFNVGISVPWRKFNVHLDELEADLLLEDRDGGYGTRVKLGLQGLCATHERVLDSVRTRLLLRRKQDKVREAVEAVFCIVLEVQKSVHDGDIITAKDSHRKMDKQVQTLVDMLRESGSKAYQRGGVAAEEREDIEAFEMLRVQLDMNGYYSSSEDALFTL